MGSRAEDAAMYAKSRKVTSGLNSAIRNLERKIKDIDEISGELGYDMAYEKLLQQPEFADEAQARIDAERQKMQRIRDDVAASQGGATAGAAAASAGAKGKGAKKDRSNPRTASTQIVGLNHAAKEKRMLRDGGSGPGELKFHRQPDNKFDANAIGVWGCSPRGPVPC